MGTFSINIDELLEKLEHAKTMSIVDGLIGSVQLSQVMDEIKQLPKDEDKIDKILSLVENLQKTIEQQNALIIKIASTISKLHQDGKINNETFNKLDEFLKPYYDNPYEKEY